MLSENANFSSNLFEFAIEINQIDNYCAHVNNELSNLQLVRLCCAALILSINRENCQTFLL